MMDGGYAPKRVEHTASIVWEQQPDGTRDGNSDGIGAGKEALKQWLVGLFRVELEGA